MHPDSLEHLLALCRSTDSPAIIEAEAISAQTAADVVERLQSEGFAARLFDGAIYHSKSDLMEAVGAAFQFPDYFGRNWDALLDCWTDMSWLPAHGYICIIEKVNVLERTHKDLLDGLRTIGEHAAKRWQQSDENRHFRLVLLKEAQAPTP